MNEQQQRQEPMQQPGETSGLDDQDLEQVSGGALRRGPGTQTEDDAFVG
jgi:hypothetical protein